MLITNQYGTVNLDWEDYKKILFNFSGGADSTLLLWLCMNELKNKPDTILQVFTGIPPSKGKFKQFTSQENFDMMRLEFIQFSDRIPERIIVYSETQNDLEKKENVLYKKEHFDLKIYGTTSNPPYCIMEKHNLLKDRIEKRDKNSIKKEWKDENIYRPFINVDKRFVAQCYEYFDLWRYYNNTISCERFRNTPDMIYNEEPCGKCWWCREKKMAFGMLDGEYKKNNGDIN